MPSRRQVVLSFLLSILVMKVSKLIGNKIAGQLIRLIGSVPITSWVYRACVIQGTQQVYVTFLWYWGSSMAASTDAGLVGTSLAGAHPRLLIGIGLTIGMIMYILAVMIFQGLPDYYKQSPGKVPAFYRTLNRRKIIVVRAILSGAQT
jgi:hypothetical protein